MSKEIRPRITEEEYELLKGIREAGQEHEVGLKYMPDGWLKTKNSSVRFKNPLYEDPDKWSFENLDFSKIPKPDKVIYSPEKPTTNGFDRLVYTDVHIGMEVNHKGKALYGGSWTQDDIKERLQIMIKHVLKHKNNDTLVIDDLGDLMDGWDSKTVRKQHELPQNMNNQEAYDFAFYFKIMLLENLAPEYNAIICHNVCDDNHSGDFGYVVNSAVKKYAEKAYKNVVINNQQKFIDHYKVCGKQFVICHGKDGENLKFGFKPFLDKPAQLKIENYLLENRIVADFVEFSKGDSHQTVLDDTTSSRFNYYNYPAFSPPSNWVKTNFQNTKSGFFFFNHTPTDMSIHPKYF